MIMMEPDVLGTLVIVEFRLGIGLLGILKKTVILSSYILQFHLILESDIKQMSWSLVYFFFDTINENFSFNGNATMNYLCSSTRKSNSIKIRKKCSQYSD